MHTLTDALKARADALARDILGKPTSSTASELRYGKKGSLAIRIAGPKAGHWYSFEYDEGGGPLALIERYADAQTPQTWAREWLGGNTPTASKTVAHDKITEHDKNTEHEDRARRIARAQDLASRPTRARDALPARRYLTNRGLNPDQTPDSIRFTSERRDVRGDADGAIIFPATDENDDVKAVQRVFITACGAKANVPNRPSKQTDGIAAGAAVRLPAGGASATVAIAEGPETALSVHQGASTHTLCALGSIKRIATATQRGAHVIIAADNDDENSPARRAIEDAAQEIRERGDRCDIVRPTTHGDWNDVIKSEGWRAISRAFADARNNDPLPASIRDALPVHEARRALQQALDTEAANRRAPALIRATPGTGKTRAALQTAIQHVRENHGAQAVILAPEHELTEQIEQDIKATKDADSVNIMRWLGADHHCSNRELLDAVRKNSGSTSKACNACPLQQNCTFTHQKQQSPHILIGAHALLRTGLPSVINKDALSLIIIDENPTSSLLHGTDTTDKINTDTLTQTRQITGKIEPNDIDEIHAVSNAIEHAISTTDKFFTRDAFPESINAKRLRDAAKLEWKAVPSEPNATQDIKQTADAFKEYAAIKRPVASRARLFNTIADWLEGNEQTCPFLELTTNDTLDGGTCSAIAMRYLASFCTNWPTIDGAKYIMLDATAETRIARRLLSSTLTTTDIAARLPENVSIRFVDGISTTSAAITGVHGSKKDKKYSRAKRARIARTAEVNHAAIIAQKAVIEALDSEHPRAIESGALHFGIERGTNELENARHLMIAGRPLPTAATAARTASAIFARFIDPAQTYERHTQTIYSALGAVIKQTWSIKHPDTDAETVRRSVTEAAITQAAHRARPINRTSLTIDVITQDTPPTLPFTEHVHIDDIEPRPRELARARGVIPETDAALAAVTSDHFQTANAIKQQRKNARQPEPVSESYREQHRSLTPVHSTRLTTACWRILAPDISRKRFHVHARHDFTRDDIEAALCANIDEAHVIDSDDNDVTPSIVNEQARLDEFDKLDDDERCAAQRANLHVTRLAVQTRRKPNTTTSALA